MEQRDDAKFVALRAKTDQELFTIVAKELEVAFNIAERSPAKARKTHDDAIALLSGMCGLSTEQKAVLVGKIEILSERLNLTGGAGGRWFTAAAGCDTCAATRALNIVRR